MIKSRVSSTKKYFQKYSNYPKNSTFKISNLILKINESGVFIYVNSFLIVLLHKYACIYRNKINFNTSGILSFSSFHLRMLGLFFLNDD